MTATACLRVRTALASAVIALLVTACGSTWEAVPSAPVTEPTGHVTAQLPAGWWRERTAMGYVLITRKGLALQSIVLSFEEFGSSSSSLVQQGGEELDTDEIARRIVEDARNSGEYESVEVLESSPTEVAGFPGARVLLRAMTGRGINYRSLTVVATTPDGLIRLAYQAPGIQFFDADLPAFERVIASVSFAK